MKIIVLLVLVACSDGNPGWNAGPAYPDAQSPSQPLCCQITKNATPDPMWQNGLYSCEDGGIPWICNGTMSCSSSFCRAGNTCQGFNGTGVVEYCPE